MSSQVIGRIDALTSDAAAIFVEYQHLRETVPVTVRTPGFEKLLDVGLGGHVEVEVRLFPAGRTSAKDNLAIMNIVGVWYPPIEFEFEDKTYRVPLSVSDAMGPVTIVLDRGTAILIPFWKESYPPKPGQINLVSVVTPAKSKESLAQILGGEQANVFIAEWVPSMRPPNFHP